jgi:hypothetical protein
MSKDIKQKLSKHFKLNDKLRTCIPRIFVPCKWAELIHAGGGMVTKLWLKYTNVSMPAQWKKRYSLCFVLPFTNLKRKQKDIFIVSTILHLQYIKCTSMSVNTNEDMRLVNYVSQQKRCKIT